MAFRFLTCLTETSVQKQEVTRERARSLHTRHSLVSLSVSLLNNSKETRFKLISLTYLSPPFFPLQSKSPPKSAERTRHNYHHNKSPLMTTHPSEDCQWIHPWIHPNRPDQRSDWSGVASAEPQGCCSDEYSGSGYHSDFRSLRHDFNRGPCGH